MMPDLGLCEQVLCFGHALVEPTSVVQLRASTNIGGKNIGDHVNRSLGQGNVFRGTRKRARVGERKLKPMLGWDMFHESAEGYLQMRKAQGRATICRSPHTRVFRHSSQVWPLRTCALVSTTPEGYGSNNRSVLSWRHELAGCDRRNLSSSP